MERKWWIEATLLAHCPFSTIAGWRVRSKLKQTWRRGGCRWSRWRLAQALDNASVLRSPAFATKARPAAWQHPLGGPTPLICGRIAWIEQIWPIMVQICAMDAKDDRREGGRPWPATFSGNLVARPPACVRRACTHVFVKYSPDPRPACLPADAITAASPRGAAGWRRSISSVSPARSSSSSPTATLKDDAMVVLAAAAVGFAGCSWPTSPDRQASPARGDPAQPRLTLNQRSW